jgi:hypothetical protein
VFTQHVGATTRSIRNRHMRARTLFALAGSRPPIPEPPSTRSTEPVVNADARDAKYLHPLHAHTYREARVRARNEKTNPVQKEEPADTVDRLQHYL